MKKWYYMLLIAVLPMLALSVASCNDDDDLPNVNITLDVTQGSVLDGTIYVAAGDTIKIGAIDVVNNEQGKAATVTNVNYYWDGLFYAPSPFVPFSMVFVPGEDQVGNHTIGVTCTVLAVDKSVASASLNYPVVVVASPEDLPAPAPAAQLTGTTKLYQ